MLGLFNRDGAHQYRLAALMVLPEAADAGVVFLQDAADHSFEFLRLGAVDHVRVLVSN